ncbi:MAG: tetratricopeptide repeat protein [Kiritimatiellia bacterium]
MTGKRILGCLAVALCCAAAVFGKTEADASDAVLRLLNSRASGSPRGYAAAAKEVAEQAKQGKAVYAFVLALVSRERDAPPAARLDEATRKTYLDTYREPIRRIAHERNNPMALYLLSLEENNTNLLHRAAEAGNIQAQNAWGAFLFSRAIAEGGSSNEVERALSQAHGYFKAAAGEGDANGLYNLGMCLWRGLGVPRDVSAAFNCFRSAAEKGHPEAINNIGAFFRDGIVVEKDLELSAKWFAKSASYDNPFGQFNYALALRRGEGVKKDFAAAAKLLERAAEGGCVEAIDAFGVALWRGEGVEADPRRAFGLFMKAAEAGYPPAMENISTCYEKGSGVGADEHLALEWKIRSRAVRGDRNAQAWLRQNAGNK